MEIYKIAIPLIFSRLGDMTASLIYFSFAGHFIVDSLDSASFALASISFITVIGIGFFSPTLIKIAGSNDLNTNNIKSEITISLRLSILFGVLIICIIFFVHKIALTPITNLTNREDIQALLLISLSIPAIYLQVTIFNFFNGVQKTHYEVIYTWTFNICLTSACIVLINTNSAITLPDFILIYSCLRCAFATLALFYFNSKIHLYINNSQKSIQIPKEQYLKYIARGLPMALCFGGESFLFFILSFISKNLGENNLSAYQASLHFISIIYMISIGIGNATGLIAARHFTRRDLGSLKKTYIQGLKSGLLTLAPFLLASVLWKENISMTYTSDSTIRKLIETNTLYSIPFLTFEFVYVLTRTILRSMDDFWAPTLLTILTLNIFGIALCAILLNFYRNIHSIFITLTICSFILMLTMFWRLTFLLKIHSSQPIGKL